MNGPQLVTPLTPTTKTLYNDLCKELNSPKAHQIQPIPKAIKAQPKIFFFLWLVAHNMVPTHDLLHMRNIINFNTCTDCNQIETTKHLIWDFKISQLIWHLFDQSPLTLTTSLLLTRGFMIGISITTTSYSLSSMRELNTLQG